MDQKQQQQQQQQQQEAAAAAAATPDDDEEEAADSARRLAGDIEARLREYLDKAGREFPAGCQADLVAGAVADRLLADAADADADADASSPPTPESLVKLCVYLMENLSDVSNAYEEFYAEQMAAQRDECASAHAQVAGLEDENGRLREQLHCRAEELRDAHKAVETLKARSLMAAGGGHQFDEAVDVEGDVDDEEVEEVKEAATKADGCQRCAGSLRPAEADAGLAEAAAQNASLRADLDAWEADMAEKVRQNVELAAQLEACQRLLGRLGHQAPQLSASRGIFGSGLSLLPRKK